VSKDIIIKKERVEHSINPLLLKNDIDNIEVLQENTNFYHQQ